MRSWVRRLSLIAALAVLVPVVAVAALIGPYVRDDWRLDGAVKAVALDWRDFGREKAVTRLQYELDHQRIGLQVSDDDCALEESPEARVVRCAWRVDVEIPAVGSRIPLAFESVARILPGGDLR